MARGQELSCGDPRDPLNCRYEALGAQSENGAIILDCRRCLLAHCDQHCLDLDTRSHRRRYRVWTGVAVCEAVLVAAVRMQIARPSMSCPKLRVHALEFVREVVNEQEDCCV